jgi:multidrug efflux pump subunit AcrB
MTFISWLLAQRHAILALFAFIIFAGILSYQAMPLKLFPDSSRPTISVVSSWPGAAAKDVASEVTHPIEVRLSAIDGVRRVTSTSRDEVSAVQVEFEYGIDISTAATNVTTELPRVTGLLPEGVRTPLIFTITEAAHPVIVLSAVAVQGYNLDLGQIRQIAENPLRDDLLRVPGVAEVEIFGGDQRRIAVDLDRDKLQALEIGPQTVAHALAGSNISRPAGLVHRDGYRLLLTAQALARLPADLANVLVPLPGGTHVRVGDIGYVSWGTTDPTSYYQGNGVSSVAVSLLRSEGGNTSEIIARIEKDLPGIQADFPMLNLSVADTQSRLIHQTVDNMLSSLRDAVIMTLAVILLFLNNSRAAFITALSIPLTYLLTFVTLYLMGLEFNMVTLTAIVIAVGLLADDAIVVIENIERRMRSSDDTPTMASVRGTGEILLADASGTITTISVLLPIMFIGGFVQTILRPLTVTLSVALAASLVVSVTIIPLLVPVLMKPGKRDPLAWLLRPFDRFFISPVRNFFVGLTKRALQHPVLVTLLLLALFAASVPQIPFLGREIMPLMDTGVIQVTFEAQPNTDAPAMASLAQQVDEAVRSELKDDWLLNSSMVIGAEAGVKSFGAARVLQSGLLTLNIVNRFQRDESIYEIESAIRARLRTIPGLISSNVFEYGATALSSIRATVDVMITGPDTAILDRLADDVVERLANVQGLTGVERSWQGASQRLNLNVSPQRAMLYGLTAEDIVLQVAGAVQGIPGGRLRVHGENPVPVWVRLEPSQRSSEESLAALSVRTSSGSLVPLSAVADPQFEFAPTAETHQALLPTVDILGYRRNIAITTLHENVAAALSGLSLPRGYTLSYEGEDKQMDESFTRLAKSLLIGLSLLFLMLIITFRSFLDPIAIMASLPLAVIGAAWAMLLADKHSSMPSFMGFILLMGIAVNNGILLIDFAKKAMADGKELKESLIQAVELRTRPILMTAGASSVGMLPIALEWAVGIERLSPLAVVAIGGLMVGTFLTLVAVPVFYYLLHRANSKITGLFGYA